MAPKPFVGEPFRVDVPQGVLDDLDRRLAATRFPAPIDDGGWEYGVDVAALPQS